MNVDKGKLVSSLRSLVGLDKVLRDLTAEATLMVIVG